MVFKADVVAADKSESKGVRECLNYGTRWDNTVESLAGIGAFSHGAAAEGMRLRRAYTVSLWTRCSRFGRDAGTSCLDPAGPARPRLVGQPEAMLEWPEARQEGPSRSRCARAAPDVGSCSSRRRRRRHHPRPPERLGLLSKAERKPIMKKILVLNGPDLNLLGVREARRVRLRGDACRHRGAR